MYQRKISHKVSDVHSCQRYVVVTTSILFQPGLLYMIGQPD